MAGVIDVENIVNYREVQEVAPLVVIESEEVRLSRALETAKLITEDRRLEVNAPSTRLQELRRHAERLEERAENEKRRRKEEHEMFVGKLREARWAISQSQVEVIENDPTSVEEVILAHLCAGEVKETEIVIKSDGKMRLSVLVALNCAIRHLTAFATSEDGDYYRGRLLPNQWREDRWIGDRDGVELKFGDFRVTSAT